MRFLGNIEAKADAKGRVSLPSVFRKVLQASGEENLVLKKDAFQNCLVLYPESVWNEQMDLVRSRLNRYDPEEQQIFRQFVSDVELLTLDGNGRFLIPKRYKALAGIEQDVRLIGVDDTVEIWPLANTAKPFVEPAEFGKALKRVMAKPSTPQAVDSPDSRQ